jgi:Kef-type K+ transport system membrane component KefB
VSFADADLGRLLIAIAALLVAAHVGGQLFARLRQPPVIGEIAGGVLLGPTILGAIAPDAATWLLPSHSAVGSAVGALSQLGLLLLLYASGAQMRSLVQRDAARTVALVTVLGLVLPFLAGLALVGALGTEQFRGPAGSPSALVLVFGIAMAVTSIPVISRIMHDLDLLDTAFARVVLGVAVIEDIALYVLLAVALSLAHTGGSQHGLGDALGLDGTIAASAYHTLAAVAFLAAGLIAGPRLHRRLRSARANVVAVRSPLAFQVLWLLLCCATAVALGLAPLFGALVAGVVSATDRDEEAAAARATVSSFGFATLIPLYFAVVGARLDLFNGFEPLFFLGFLGFACVAKAASVYAGARVAGERPARARDLAVALNARGGPGIVLASTTFDAGIIDQGFFATLVLLAIATSLLAGWWLDVIAPRLRAAERPAEQSPGAVTEAGRPTPLAA